jgi:hypothetical protein
MKSLAVLITALSLAGSCLSSATLAAPEDGAKGLFFEQLDHPSDNLNTGIQYWIELHHNGETIHATNKTAFHTGDKIRFHVRPNIDGFAYIMLKSGSRGEQAVLFPSKGRDENNKISRGKEIVLPDDGMLSFDENPGTEKLTLLVSRKPIDTEAYLSTGSANSNDSVDDKAPRLVAMSSSGSKDLIPNQVLVAYLPSSVGAPESVKAAAAAAVKASKQSAAAGSKQEETTNQKTSPVAKNNSSGKSKHSTGVAHASSASASDTTASSNDSATSTSTTASGKASKVRTSKNSHQSTASKGNTHKTASIADLHDTVAATQPEKVSKAGLVTVVFKNPDSVLAADISLEHL